MAGPIKVTRICPGEYEVRVPSVDSFGPKFVRVTRVYYPGDGTYWIAAANWDRLLYSDPLPRKKDAVQSAEYMLTEYDGGSS